MDQVYDEVAGAYGFYCFPCSDNCCLTRFYHHTVIEFLYLRTGFADLEEHVQEEIRIRSAEVNEKVLQEEAIGNISRVMCPLNIKGLCVLYEYRPMICRLHGIPHEFSHPIKHKIFGPGCHEFDAQCGHEQYRAFNRTPFYQEMARLEQCVRGVAGITQKFKKTVAQMLVSNLETG
ncbi:MAG: hypothetical protein J7K96_00380, partial [Desulfobacteraceae bacterium]|nr:hypothetical protein [Desulfobacteraceae bacterium]